MPAIHGILETSLYVADVSRSQAFYERVFGFPVLVSDARIAALKVGERDVLLLFLRGGTTQPVTLPGGVLPPHDGAGQNHFAFTIPAEALAEWEAYLPAQGVPIESRINWPEGAVSLYFRDPDGHLGELATPGLWGIQ